MVRPQLQLMTKFHLEATPLSLDKYCRTPSSDCLDIPKYYSTCTAGFWYLTARPFICPNNLSSDSIKWVPPGVLNRLVASSLEQQEYSW